MEEIMVNSSPKNPIEIIFGPSVADPKSFIAIDLIVEHNLEIAPDDVEDRIIGCYRRIERTRK